MSCVPSPSDHALVDIQDTYGALFLGVVVSVAFLGIATVQGWIFWLNYPDDILRTKVTVLVVWILEFIRCSFGVHAVYHYVVIQWGNPAALSKSIWSRDVNLLITALVQVIVHWYFAYRVKILSRGNWVLVSIIGILAFGNFSMTTATYGASVAASTYSKIEGQKTFSTEFSTAALSCAIATDICITFSLMYYLNQINRAGSGLRDVINRLIFYAINVGMITSMADVVVLILSSISRKVWTHEGLYYFAIYEIVGGFYVNSLLATLNARKGLRGADIHVSSLQAASPPPTEPERSAIVISQMASNNLGTVKDRSKGFAVSVV